MKCNLCGHNQCALILAANTKKPMNAVFTSKALQGEGEVAAAQITLVFVGSSDLVANLFSVTDLFNADFRAHQLFEIAEPNPYKPEFAGAAYANFGFNGKDEIPPRSFMGDDNIETVARLLLGLDELTAQGPVLLTGLGNANDLTDFDPALISFDPALLAVLKAKGVMVMGEVSDGGKLKVEMISANGVAQIDDMAAKNLDNDAWARAREAMFGGGAYSLTDMVLTAGRDAIDDDTGWPDAGPMAATHGHLAARERQAALV